MSAVWTFAQERMCHKYFSYVKEPAKKKHCGGRPDDQECAKVFEQIVAYL